MKNFVFGIGGVVLGIASYYLILNITVSTPKKVNDFNIYDPEVIELSIRKEVETKYMKTPVLYKEVLQKKLDEAYAYLKYLSKEKPLYALGARIGGVDITNEIIKKLGVEKTTSFESKGKKIRDYVPYNEMIEKMKQDLMSKMENEDYNFNKKDKKLFLP